MSLSAITGDSDADRLDLSRPISPSARLYRRVPANQVVFIEHADGSVTCRPASHCFSDNASTMSLFDSELCGGVEPVMKGHEGFYLVSFSADDLRSLGMEVYRTGEGGPGHCEAKGAKTKSVQRKMAKVARWEISPTTDR